MTTWQRRVRIGVVALGAGFALFVWMSVRKANPPPQNRGLERLDPTASVESTGGVIQQLRGGKENFRMEYGSLLSYADRRAKYRSVKVFADQRAGRNFRITGQEAETVGEKQDRILIKGSVVLTSDDGLKATTDEATYEQSTELVRAPGPLQFTERGLTGTSVGMTYDKTGDILSLLDQVVLKTTPSKPDDEPIEIRSGAAVFARGENQIDFDRTFSAKSGKRTFDSDSATSLLVEDGSRMRMLEMTGHARISGIGEGGGALKNLSASSINLEFLADGRTLQGAVLAGGASIQLGGDGTSDRRIAGEWVDVRLAPDGVTVVGLTARDRVRLELPAEKTDPARTIQADTLTAKGEPGKGLTTATFVDRVEYRELFAPKPGAPPAQRVARSKTLAIAVQPGFSSIDDARFDGAVRFEDGDTKAAAGQARYMVPKGLLILDGVDLTTGLKPRVNDDQVNIQGTHIELTLEGRKIAAKEDVRSVMLGSSNPKPGGPSTVRRPAMLKPDQPVFATAATLDYDGASGKANYSGSSRLWQGDTSIQGDRITMDDQTGDLTAHGSVRSVFVLDQGDAATKRKDKAFSVGRAEDLKYEDAVRRASYTGKAHVSGPEGDLQGDTVELYLKESGSEMDRVEGYKNVTLKSDGRTATGDRLTYSAADERYDMAGAPVKIVSECRETTGRTLRFYKSSDRILVDGKEERRTETKGGAKCGEPR
jgi:lipopolysaccharide export system protein LptA